MQRSATSLSPSLFLETFNADVTNVKAPYVLPKLEVRTMKRPRRLIQYGKRSKRKLQDFSFFGNDTNMGSFFPKTFDQTQQPPSLPPNKPTSQKQATMPLEPKEDDVQMLMEITGIPKLLAVRYLRV